jgi:hypothetical protein
MQPLPSPEGDEEDLSSSGPPASDYIQGDLTPSQLAELRRNLSSSAQMQNAAQVMKLLASQHEQFMHELDGRSAMNTLPADADNLITQRLGIAEANARLAEAGLKPIDTVEGKIAAMRFIVEHVVEAARLEPTAKLEAEKVIIQYRELLITQQSKLQIALLEAQNKELAARNQQMTLHYELELKKKGSIAELDVAAEAAEARRDQYRVAIERTRIVTSAERASLRRKQRIALLREQVSDHNEIRNLRQQLWGRRTRIAITALILLIIVSNLVADNPPDRHVFLLGFINQAWDAVYMPIRAGIVHAIDTTF